MTETRNISPDSSAADSPVDHLPAFPWWGWTVFLTGVLCVLGGLDSLIPRLPYVWPTISEFLMPVVSLGMLGCALGGLTRLGMSLTGLWRQRPASPHNRTLMLLGGAAFCLGIGFTFVALSIPAFHNAARAMASAHNGQWTDRPVGVDNLVLSAPGNWEVTSSPEQSASLYLIDSQNDLHLMVTAVSKEDVTFKTLSQFYDLTLKGILLSDVQVEELPQPPADPVNKIDFTMTGTLSDTQRWQFRMRLMETERFWVEVRVWGRPSQLAEVHESVERIVSSVHQSDY